MPRGPLQTRKYGNGYRAAVLIAGLVLAEPGSDRCVFGAHRPFRLLENPITELELGG